MGSLSFLNGGHAQRFSRDCLVYLNQFRPPQILTTKLRDSRLLYQITGMLVGAQPLPAH